MKTLGIIGGIAPESTIEYYRAIIAIYRERTGDGSYPPLIINSIDLTAMFAFVLAGDRRGLVAHLLPELQKLAAAGAELAIFASNTPHVVFDEISAASPLPMISIVEVTADAAVARGLRRVGLFGTRPTMQAEFYPRVFAQRGIELIVPRDDEQELIHAKYMGELVQGRFLPETRAKLLTIAERLKREENAEAIVLGGTELPLLLREEGFLDTGRIHAEAVVTEMLRGGPLPSAAQS